VRPLWNVRRVSEETGLHPETIRTLARRGQIPAFKAGERTSPYLFRPEAITAWIASREAVNARRAG
jgi:DNA-binding transcriptional MerR regulator